MGTLRPFSRSGGVSPAPNPAALSILQVPSPNHFTGRSGNKPLAIVIHTMVGTLAACDSWFSQSISQVSAHFGVGLDGSVHQYVQLSDGAWGNGILDAGATWPLRASLNPNYVTVSIETEDNGNTATPVSAAQYSAVVALIKGVIRPACPTIMAICGHNTITPINKPNCPGARWRPRWASLVADTGLTDWGL